MRRLFQALIWTVTLAVVLFAVGVVLHGARTLTRPAWLRAFAQKAVAQELANLLGRPVRLGPAEGDLWSGLTIKGVSVDDDAGRPELAVEEIHVDWNLPALVRRKVEPARAIRRIRLVRPYLHLLRDEQGVTNLERLIALLQEKFKPRGPRRPLREMGFVVEIVDGRIDYDLQGPGLPGGHHAGSVTAINGRLDPRRPELWLASLSFKADGQYLDAAQIEAGFSVPTGQVGAQVSTQGLRLARLLAVVGPVEGVQVNSGVADATVSLWVPARGAEPRWALTAGVRGLAGAVQGAPGPIRVPWASVAASSSGVWVSAPRLYWRSSSAAAEVSVWDFSSVALSVHVDQLHLAVADARSLVPPEQLDALGVTPEITWVTGSADLIGPAAHLDCTARLTAEGPVRVKYEDTVVEAAALQIEAEVTDLANPAATALVRLEGVRAEGLPSVRLPSGEEAVPQVSPLPEIEVQAAWAGETLVLHTQVQVASVGGLPLAAEDLAADVSLAGDVVSARQVQVKVAGGEVKGEVVG
ncbi:MAG: hypothetical protein J7M26_03705, partial [Armatimonadetes bacterium]|nr:hypothetical protein [Armatimonadota bacterium]